MIYLELFLVFLEVGALSFGGGMGMISMIRDLVISHGWLTEEELLNMIAVSESTPGPIAVNIATFVGSSQGGILGALLATIGVVLPSFIIILIIASLIRNLLKYRGVSAFLSGIRPSVVALIIGTAITLFISGFFGFSRLGDSVNVDYSGLLVFFSIAILASAYKRVARRSASPFILIISSALLGMLLC